MLAYKCLGDGGRSTVSGFRWPLPERGRPGTWVEVERDLVLCRNGVHACTVRQLPHWLGKELWVVELGGQVVDVDGIFVSSRARLVRAIAAWSADARTDFARTCVTRVQEAAPHGQYTGELEDMNGFAQSADAVAAGYVAAVVRGKAAAGGLSDGVEFDRGYLDERAAQSQWLAEHLGLVDDRQGPDSGT